MQNAQALEQEVEAVRSELLSCQEEANVKLQAAESGASAAQQEARALKEAAEHTQREAAAALVEAHAEKERLTARLNAQQEVPILPCLYLQPHASTALQDTVAQPCSPWLWYCASSTGPLCITLAIYVPECQCFSRTVGLCWF